MTSVNINFGTGTNKDYDDIAALTGGHRLNGAFFNNSTYLEAISGALQYTSSTYTLSFWYKIGSDLPNLYEDNRPVFVVQDCQCNLYGLGVWMQRDVFTDEVHLNIYASAQDQSQISRFWVEDIPTHDDTWHHVAIYEQSYPTVSKVYIDGVLQTIVRLYELSRNVPFNYGNQWRVGGGDNDTDNRFNGCLDEVWFTHDDFDIGVAANLEKLLDTTNLYPKFLGAKGDRPTGKPSLVYMKNECEDFYINYGVLPKPFDVYGELPCCDERIVTEIDCDRCGQIFEDPNKPCGWVIRIPKLMQNCLDNIVYAQQATASGTANLIEAPAVELPPSPAPTGVLYDQTFTGLVGSVPHGVTKAEAEIWLSGPAVTNTSLVAPNDGFGSNSNVWIVDDPLGQKGHVLRIDANEGYWGLGRSTIYPDNVPSTCQALIHWANSSTSDELYLEYDVMVDSDFIWPNTIKIPGFFSSLAGASAGSGAYASISPTVWGVSKPGIPVDGMMASNYFWIGLTRTQRRAWTDPATNDTSIWEANPNLIQWTKNTWHSVKVRVKMNTMLGPTPQNDGILECWWDGVKVYSKTDIAWIDEASDDLYWDFVKLQCFYGGSVQSDAAPQDQSMYFDNFIIYDEVVT